MGYSRRTGRRTILLCKEWLKYLVITAIKVTSIIIQFLTPPAKHSLSTVILNEQSKFSFPLSSVTLYNTSVSLGTSKYAPACLSEKMEGSAPELSVHSGSAQFTLTSEPVALT